MYTCSDRFTWPLLNRHQADLRQEKGAEQTGARTITITKAKPYQMFVGPRQRRYKVLRGSQILLGHFGLGAGNVLKRCQL